MIDIIIADDEQWIRMWLEKVISDFDNDYRIVKVCKNGREVLDFIKESYVNVIVCDIKMPQVTGMEICEYVYQNRLKTKIILVSGYNDFEYARRAIKYKVSSYLLKPIDKEELRQSLEELAEQISVGEGDIVHNAIENYLAEYYQTLDNILLYKIDKQLGIVNKNNKSNIFICDINLNIVENYDGDVKEIIVRVLSKLEYKFKYYVVRKTEFNYILTILYEDYNQEILIKECVKSSITKELNKVKIIISKSVKSILNLPNLIEQINKSNIIEKKSTYSQINNNLLYAIRSRLIISIKSYNYENVTPLIDNLKDEFNNNYDIKESKVFIFCLINEIIEIIKEIDDENQSTYVDRGIEFCVKINAYNDIDSILEWVLIYIYDVIEFLKVNQCYDVSAIVKKVKLYMMENYSKDLSISEICNRFGINTSYFSKKFKDESGINFTDMLINIRMNAAREILINTDKSIVDVCNTIGIKDSKYFSKVFKKYFHYTPSEYRKMNRNLEVGNEK